MMGERNPALEAAKCSVGSHTDAIPLGPVGRAPDIDTDALALAAGEEVALLAGDRAAEALVEIEALAFGWKSDGEPLQAIQEALERWRGSHSMDMALARREAAARWAR